MDSPALFCDDNAYWAIFGGFFRAGFTGLAGLLVNLRGPFLAHAENIRTGAGT